MSEFKHTPGPWFVGNQGRFLVCTLTPVVQIYADQMVRTDAVHDARIIAAAPELLEALQEVFSDADKAKSLQWINKAAYAIAKATGE